MEHAALSKQMIALSFLIISFVMIAPAKARPFSTTTKRLLSFTITHTKPIRRRGKLILLPSQATQYTINDDVCAPMDEAELSKVVQRNFKSLPLFLQHKPIAAHTKAAFDDVFPHVDSSQKIIIDSGCGTGRSTLLLGDMYPDHTVIGVDRSFVRLTKNFKNENWAIDTNGRDESQRPYQAISSNVLLVRAELTDFWRCCLQAQRRNGWDVSHHFIYYPNPYPKKNRLKKRFYAHASFPLILQLGGEIAVRSNWEGYLKEFAQSVLYGNQYYIDMNLKEDNEINVAAPYVRDALKGPIERTDKDVAMTNFEKKYDDIGEKTYELLLRRET